MFVLTVNTGSSSVRLALYAREAKDLRARGDAHYESDAGDPRARLQAFLDRHAGERPQLVAHRLVHGGAQLTSTRRIDAEVEAEIERLAPLAPLHNPVALAHQALWSRWRELRPDVSAGGRVISFQLGAGCSVTAIGRGRALDTSMGFSPLEGLMMATRSGDVDPGLVTFLRRVEGMSAPDVEQLLNERSGLLGVSGTSGDMRQLLGTDDPHARLAVQIYCYRARKYLGAYLTVLGGADAILFGGGVGENAAAVRAGILEGLDWAGIRLDAAANAATTGREGRISAADSRIEAWVIPVDEARLLAQEAFAAATA